MTEDEMVRWHHQLNGHESEQTLGDSEGQGSLGAVVHGSQRIRHDWRMNNEKALSASSGHLRNKNQNLSENCISLWLQISHKAAPKVQATTVVISMLV